MATKPKTKTKPAAPAGKKEPAKKIPPLRITGQTCGGTGILTRLDDLPAKQLKELLRERGVPIPKDKLTMANRLHDWFARPEGIFTLTLG